MHVTETQQPIAVMRSGSEEDARARRAARNRQRRRVQRLRRALLVLVLLAGAVTVVVALLPKPVPVDIARVSRGPLVVEVHQTGQTRVKDRYVVSAPVAGNLVRLALEPNDPVAEGQVLAQIAPTSAPLLDARSRDEAEVRLAAALSAAKQAESQVALARTATELAASELARATALGRAGSAPRRVLEEARFQARMREGELTSAVFARKVAAEQVRLVRAALAPRRRTAEPVDVLSPTPGHVLRVLRESAAVVSAGTPLLEVGDLGGLEVVVDLLTTDAVQVRAGTPVTIEGWGGERSLVGRVRKVELGGFTRPSALGVDEQRANTIIVFSDPRERWATLGDGYRVEVRLVLWRAEQAVKVSQGAVFRRGDGWAAFRVDGGVARLVPVRVGHRGETEVEVLSGLTPGATVVVDPGDRVEEGVRVVPR
jgi:HlyD family secretion protein